MTLLDELFRSYGFKELVDLIINKLGFSALIVLLGAFFAAIVYFSALPSKGRFSTDFPRSNAVGIFQQTFYVFSFLIFLMPFISGWGALQKTKITRSTNCSEQPGRVTDRREIELGDNCGVALAW